MTNSEVLACYTFKMCAMNHQMFMTSNQMEQPISSKYINMYLLVLNPPKHLKIDSISNSIELSKKNVSYVRCGT